MTSRRMMMMLHRIPLLLALIALSVPGCADMRGDPFQYGTVEVVAVTGWGEPVADVHVVLFTGTRQLDSGETDRDGRHLFRFVPFGTMGMFTILPDAHRSVTPDVATFQMREGEERVVTFIYDRCGDPGSIFVRVRDQKGRPVADAGVALFRSTVVMADTLTDASGELAFLELRCGRDYGVGITPPSEHRVAEGRGLSFFDGIAMDGANDNVHRLDFVLISCGDPGSVFVRVRDQNGRPVAGAGISLFASTEVVADGVTDALGEHAFLGVRCGRDYGVRITPPSEHRVAEGRGLSFIDGLAMEGENDNVHRLDFVLISCGDPGSVFVRVRDQNGRPVAGAGVTLFTSTEVVADGVTDALGEHAFLGVRCGRDYGVRVIPPRGYEVEEGRGLSFIDGLAMEGENDNVHDLDFVLTSCGEPGSIRVRVSDQDGQSVPGAGLVLFTSTGTLRENATDALGEHAFLDVPCGEEYGVRVLPPEGYGVEEGRGVSFFDGLVIDGQPGLVFNLNFVITRF